MWGTINDLETKVEECQVSNQATTNAVKQQIIRINCNFYMIKVINKKTAQLAAELLTVQKDNLEVKESMKKIQKGLDEVQTTVTKMENNLGSKIDKLCNLGSQQIMHI